MSPDLRGHSLRVWAAVRDLQAVESSGLVALPRLREALARIVPRSPDARRLTDAALLLLERQGRVQCLVAHHPAALPDRGEGIEIPGRGLLYYVALVIS